MEVSISNLLLSSVLKQLSSVTLPALHGGDIIPENYFLPQLLTTTHF